MRQKEELHKIHYHGFRFIGITSAGEEIQCVVEQSDSGWGIVLNESDQTRVWKNLIGWKPCLLVTPQRTAETPTEPSQRLRDAG